MATILPATSRVLPPFADIRGTVERDTIRVASHYRLVTDFFFKVMKQQELVNHYPWMLEELMLAVTSSIVMTLGRLFEWTDDPRRACLNTFLLGVEFQHSADTAGLPEHAKERRAAYFARIPEWQQVIKKTHAQLALRRNFDLAHNDLTKVGKTDLTWLQLNDMISVATEILGRYFGTFEATDHRFVVTNADHEPEAFLKWCRLDDYNAHKKKAWEQRKARIEEWGRRRAAGDPTAGDIPPLE